MKTLVTALLIICFNLISFAQADQAEQRKAPVVAISGIFGDGQMLDYGQAGAIVSVRTGKKLRCYAQYLGSLGKDETGALLDYTGTVKTVDENYRVNHQGIPYYTDYDHEQHQSFAKVDQKMGTFTAGLAYQLSKRSYPFSSYFRLGLGMTSYSTASFKETADYWFWSDNYGSAGDLYYSDYTRNYTKISEEKKSKFTGELGLDFYYSMLAFGASYQVSPSSWNFHLGVCF